MSQVTLSPAIVQRIQSFALTELDQVAQVCNFVSDNAEASLASLTLEHIRGELEATLPPLLEALGGEDDDVREIFPLPHPAPYLLPLALTRVVSVCARALPLVQGLSLTAGGHERLALDYLAERVCYIGETASYIRSTVLEELPPLAAHAPVEARAVTA